MPYYNVARSHASLDGHTPLTFAGGHTMAPANLNHVRWVSHAGISSSFRLPPDKDFETHKSVDLPDAIQVFLGGPSRWAPRDRPPVRDTVQ